MTGMKKTVSLALAFILSLYLAIPAAAAETAAVMKLTKTEGTVAVSKSNGKAVSLRADLRLYSGYNVTTEAESYAWINLDSSKLMKLDASTSVEVRKSGSKLEVNVKSGSVSFDVSEKLSSGESLNVSTSTMAVGIRGTCGWVRVTDQWVTEVCLLEGRAQCVAEDPVTSQLKSAWLTGGDTARCVVYPQDKPGDKCDILIERQTTGGIPGFVLSELVRDVPLCDRILDDSGLDVLSDLAMTAGGDPSGRSPDGASASPEVLGLTGRRLKQEETEHEQKQADILKDVERQENSISKDPVWESGQQPSASGGGGSSGGGSSQPARPTAATRTMPLTAGELQTLLNQYNSVTVQPNADAGKNTLELSSALNVPAGKTLTLQNGVGVEVGSGQTLNVDGTMHVEGGGLTNAGTVRVTSGDTLHVKGDFSGYGAVEVTATGKLVADGRFDRPGTFLLERGARVLAGAFAFTDFPEGWKKTGPDAGGYYSLEFADVVYTVSFDSRGGSAVASAQVIPGGSAAMPEAPARTGCTFDGWYREEACETAWDFDADAVTEDVTLYAKWLGYSYANGALTVSDDAAMADKTWESAQGYDASALESVTILDGVTVIKDLAFAGCDSLTSVDIPGSVTEIASGAFMYCSRLAAVTIPDSVETIGTQAFSFCDSLTDVTVPASVTYMADAVFLQCTGLKTAAILGSLESIKSQTFSGCTSLTSVEIPGSVTGIENTAFGGCDSLKDIYYGNERDEWKKLNCSLPESVTVHCTDGDTPCFVTFDSQDGSEALRKPVGVDYRVLYPDAPVREGYIFIDWYKEPACENAWDLYDRVEKDLTLYARWAPVYTVAFDANGGSVTPASGVTDAYGKLGSLPTPTRTLPGRGVDAEFTGWFREDGTQIGEDEVFTGDCTVTAHWAVDWDFADGKLTIIGNGPMEEYTVEYMGGGFERSTAPWGTDSYQIETIEIESGVTRIGDYSFYNSDVYNNILATEVSIPGSVTSIGFFAFHYCDKLETIRYGGTKKEWDAVDAGDADIQDGVTVICSDGDIEIQKIQWEFDRDTGTLRIFGTGRMEDYRWTNTSGSDPAPWIYLNPKEVQIEEGITRIGDLAFYSDGDLDEHICPNLAAVSIADSVTSIGSSAFYKCTSLTSVTIPEGMTSIEANAFGESGLTDITFKGTQEQWNAITMGNYAFPDGVTVHCTDGEITIRKIESEFDEATGTLRIFGTGPMEDYTWEYIPGGNPSPWVIDHHNEIQNAVIEEGVTRIGDRAFYSDGEKFGECTCPNLTAVSIPDSVTSIGNLAFNECTGLTAVNYQGTKEQWDRITIDSGSGLSGKTVIFSDGTTDTIP